jgi:hypothetical protein
MESLGETQSKIKQIKIRENPTNYRIITNIEPYYEISTSDSKVEILRDLMYIEENILKNMEEKNINDLLKKICIFAGSEIEYKVNKKDILELHEEVNKNRINEVKNEGFLKFIVENTINSIGDYSIGIHFIIYIIIKKIFNRYLLKI